MTRATLTLPWPPTMNLYWRSRYIPGKKPGQPGFISVYVSDEGKAFQLNVQAAVLGQGWPRFFEDRITVDIVAHAPDRRDRDLDNLLKPTLDALANAGVYTNDAQIDRVQIARGTVRPKGGSLVVTITSVETAGLFSGEAK